MFKRTGRRVKGLAGIKVLVSTVGILMVVIPVSYIIWRVMAEDGKGKAGPGGSPPAAPPPEVAVMVMQPERVTITTELPGRISAYLVAEVRPQVSGIIQKRLFNEGVDVKAGDLLYQIDAALHQAAFDNAAANLTGAQKAAERAQSAVEGCLAVVKQQQATLDLAQTNRQRFENLAKEGAVSASERDKAVTDSEVAVATLRSAEAQLRSAREAVGAAEAAILQAEAAQQTARINLGYTRITAPISGRIGRSNVTVGSLVTAQQPVALATIQQLDPIYADAPQSSTNLLRLKRNIEAGRIKGDGPNQATVKLILEDGMPYSSEGTLKFSDVTIDPGMGSFIFRMVFPNPKQILLPNMYVRAILEEGVIEQAILAPQQGVSRDLKGNPIALIVDAEGKVQQRALELDRAIGAKWLVSAGLKPGDKVIVEGSQKARPGSTVKAVPFQAGQKDGTKAVKTIQPDAKAN
ncbi:MAG: efflux RND transporter periplasmic adaptor subunit [Candidatus Sumerlaeota bacterium]|nr:efflux RND transporter periplasmic adaptor subunit [Candidatus Sumerlaeota bacterium]